MAYDEAYFRTRETWRDWRIEARELIQAAQLRHSSRVLEIGCGGGGLMRMLREQGARVIGLDTLDAALKLAKRQLDADTHGETQIKEKSVQPPVILAGIVRIGKSDALPFVDASFDAVISQHVIEHLADSDAALHEWHRLLRSNGRVALATPNARYIDIAHFADADHTHIFSTRDLKAVVEKNGFIVERCSTIFPFLTKTRVLRAVGVVAYNLFQRTPYFSERGRTIILGARKA